MWRIWTRTTIMYETNPGFISNPLSYVCYVKTIMEATLCFFLSQLGLFTTRDIEAMEELTWVC